MSIRLINGDCTVELPKLAAEGLQAHCAVTDPPYHLTSIVKRFGSDSAAPVKAGKTGAYARASAGFMGQQWDGGDIAMRPETWAAVFECLRPGAFLAAFASTRGYHRMACAIEDAGFIIHPMIAWVFASGFPKATRFNQPELEGWRYGLQALKPAIEPICLAQKPMIGTGSQNWDRFGTGGLNVDACRVPGTKGVPASPSGKRQSGYGMGAACETGTGTSDVGRWPANIVTDGSPEVEEAFARFGESRDGVAGIRNGTSKIGPEPGAYSEEWGGYGGSGSPSRFYFSAKADASDRAGSRHPTVKPTSLMRWLVQLVCPPGGMVLDPFAGTGSTGLAADQLGFDAVLIERDPTYAKDAERKIKQDAPLFAEVQQPTPDLDAAYQRQPALFEASK